MEMTTPKQKALYQKLSMAERKFLLNTTLRDTASLRSLGIDLSHYNKMQLLVVRLMQVENLMLEGITNPYMIASLAGLNHSQQAERYIKLVHVSWKVKGRKGDFEQKRGEILSRIERTRQELWSLYQAAEQEAPNSTFRSIKARRELLKEITHLDCLEMALFGIQPTAVQKYDDLHAAPQSLPERLRSQPDFADSCQELLTSLVPVLEAELCSADRVNLPN
jgi:hypothetical protein